MPDHLWISVLAAVQILGGPVRAVGGNRVQGVGNGKDSCPQRDFIALQSPRISCAIVAFLVSVDDLSGFLKKRDFPQDLVSVQAVFLHDAGFGGSQGGRFAENCVGNRHLPDVVKKSTASDDADRFGEEH